MENKSNYINLEQVAQVTGDSVDVVKSKIFDRKLMPSYHITRSVSVDIYTWVDAKDDNGPYKETEEIGVDVLFTGFVRISGARRDSGGTGKIQLCLKNYENPEEWPGTPIRLYHWNEEQAREEIIYPKKSLKISENSLIVHWDHLREYINDDPEAIDRYEELRSSEFNPERNKSPEEQPPANKMEVVRQLVLTSRKAGKKDAEIAVDIDEGYPGFSDAELGGLFPGSNEYSARRKRGQRARGKVK